MKKHLLQATVRQDVGKRVSALRKQGMIPATVYGKGIKSLSVVMPVDTFRTVYKEAGETGLIELTVEKAVHHVLIHSVQIHPVTSQLLHVEFHQVNLKEKIHAKVAVEQTGESPAAAQKLGVVMTLHDAIEVEALPTDLPEKMIIDISSLAEVGHDITAAHIKLPSGVTLITDPATVLVKVGPLVTKEAEAEVAADAVDASDASAAAEAATAADEKATKENAEAASTSEGK